jgi:hypothetical protein
MERAPTNSKPQSYDKPRGKAGSKPCGYGPLGCFVCIGHDIEARRLLPDLPIHQPPESRHDLRLGGLREDVTDPESVLVG